MVVQPTYPLTSGLSQTQIRSVVKLALESLNKLCFPPEWIDQELMQERGWPSFKDALQAAHNPQEEVIAKILVASPVFSVPADCRASCARVLLTLTVFRIGVPLPPSSLLPTV